GHRRQPLSGNSFTVSQAGNLLDRWVSMMSTPRIDCVDHESLAIWSDHTMRSPMSDWITKLSLAFAFLLSGPGIALAADSPNVVLIIADDLAWTDYGFMGHPVVKTPHLDRLASESATFVNGYVPTSLCRPSLVTLVSG